MAVPYIMKVRTRQEEHFVTDKYNEVYVKKNIMKVVNLPSLWGNVVLKFKLPLVVASTLIIKLGELCKYRRLALRSLQESL